MFNVSTSLRFINVDDSSLSSSSSSSSSNKQPDWKYTPNNHKLIHFPWSIYLAPYFDPTQRKNDHVFKGNHLKFFDNPTIFDTKDYLPKKYAKLDKNNNDIVINESTNDFKKLNNSLSSYLA